MWNVIYYIRHMDNEKDRMQSRTYARDSILALFIMLSVWGILGIFTGIFFQSSPVIPQLQTSEKGGAGVD
jgi:cbb3-type cytochrome oxidase subunit 1